MEVPNDNVGDALKTMLGFNGFAAVDTFGEFITYKRIDDPITIHVGTDGTFTALDGDETVVSEGVGAQDLFAMLVQQS